jgi:DNA repair protein SbcC/Rad50
MIPLRVYVKGFMSYRDETEFRFQGASLWVLAGRNGVGKSAVFDAITFALYGEHRGGKNNADALINQQSDSLVVEYDFAIGDEEYRVKRTLSRKHSTCQAFRLSGPKATPQAIPGTDRRTSLERWSESIIGLSFETFTASVLLRQNKSDLLITAKPSERHEMMSQLVDLSAYIRFHQQVDDLHKQLERDIKSYQKQLQAIEPVSETELAALNDQIQEIGRQLAGALTKLERFAALKEQAKSWSNLSDRHNQVEQDLSGIYAVLAKAEDIEQKSMRLATVIQVLPSLKRLAETQNQLEAIEISIEAYQRQMEDWSDELEQARTQKTNVQEALELLKAQQRTCQQQREQAQQDKLELISDIEKIRQLESIRSEVEKLDQALALFPSDLELRINELRQETEKLSELKIALPWLEQYAGTRQEWQDATLLLEENQASVAQVAIYLEIARERQANVEERSKNACNTTQHARQVQTAAEIMLSDARKHLTHFEEVDGQTTCSYCGQPLTSEHLEKERTRLESEVQVALQAFEVAQQSLEVASEQQKQVEGEKRRIEEESRRLEEEERTLQETLRNAQNSQRQASHQASKAINALPTSYQQNIMTSPTDDITVCLVNEYPSQAELDAFREQVVPLDEKNADLRELLRLCNKQSEVLAKRSPNLEKLNQLEAVYPAQREQNIRAWYQRAEDNYKSSVEKQGEIDTALQEAELTNGMADKVLQEAEQHLQISNLEKSLEEARKEQLQRTLINRLSELPDTYQAMAGATAIQLERHLEALQVEAEALTDADALYEQLKEARKGREYQEKLKSQIEQDMAQIEQDARRSLSEIERDEQDTRADYEEVTIARSRAETAKRDLENRRDQREHVERLRHEAASKAYLYKRLAHLLGPDCLQNHLLLQTQGGIVAHANAILNRISSGTLRIELRQFEEAHEDKGRTKTLDLVAYNSEVGTEPLPVSFLSGSQKFRVAVSLALGIGQYTNCGTRQIESVIIDEGFGSLDKEGREEMIHELRLLKGVLRCIILVSHQEEFVDAFDNGYAIELVDSASKVSLR